MKITGIGLATVAFGLVVLAGCQTSDQAGGAAPSTSVAAVDLGFDWGGTRACFEPRSPAFTVAGVPEGTQRLRFRMVDKNAPNFNHGGGTVSYAGRSQVPAGAFNYQGPCPPSGAHIYRWTVEALDGGSKVIGRGTAERAFSQ